MKFTTHCMECGSESVLFTATVEVRWDADLIKYVIAEDHDPCLCVDNELVGYCPECDEEVGVVDIQHPLYIERTWEDQE